MPLRKTPAAPKNTPLDVKIAALSAMIVGKSYLLRHFYGPCMSLSVLTES